MEMVTLWTNEMQGMSSEKLSALLKLGEGISKLLDVKDKLLLR
jgi:hypothetical protein